MKITCYTFTTGIATRTYNNSKSPYRTAQWFWKRK